jgi:hypothetical protein
VFARGADWNNTGRIAMVKVVKQHGGAVFGSPQGIELKISKLRELK